MMALEKYRKKRKFSKTSEPEGKKKARSSKKPIFVVQKHDARNMHYDFRIEVEGVLKSWAVPKGPSLNPEEKRLAIETEDHPMDYADFEGVIPEGEYGGGTVMVWDKGTYKNIRAAKKDDGADMKKSYGDGKIEVWLEGEKLKGGYVLIKTDYQENSWLVKKIEDGEADKRLNPVNTKTKSIKS
ncbi:DNA ligase, partial [Candidatus Woesearchaeota archaeon]|nr:DNA ligase [Candidatus Woesearchaeota archaeon]